MLSVKQGGIKYNFWVFVMTQPWDWTQVSWTIGEHSTQGIWTLLTDPIFYSNNCYAPTYTHNKIKLFAAF